MSFTDWLDGLRRPPYRTRRCSRRNASYTVLTRVEPLESRTVLTTLELSQAGVAAITVFGETQADLTGVAVGTVGDLNGDGYDEILIAAEGSLGGRGRSVVIFGGPTYPNSIDLANDLGSLGIEINGIDLDQSGQSVGGAGDVNGDGFDDLLIGAPYSYSLSNERQYAGESYVVFGGPSLPPIINLASLGAGGVTIFGADAGDNSGFSVNTAGDVNGDGFDDIVIGAPKADGAGNGNEYAGEAYIIFGAAALPQTMDLANLGPAGTTILGIDAFDRLGWAVNTAGDVNGDGFDDVVIGADTAAGVGNARPVSGESHIIFGAPTLPTALDAGNLGNAGFTIVGANPGQRAGGTVSGAGDVNGDGFEDLIIGARYGRGPGGLAYSSGEAYIVFGGAVLGATIDLGNLGSNGVTIFGADDRDHVGSAVSGVGDINGDGFDDVALGAFGASGIGNVNRYTGEVYVIFGGAALPTSIDLESLSDSQGLTIFGIEGYDALSAVDGAADVNGDGFDDLVLGAAGAGSVNNDRTGAGEAYVVYGRNFTNAVTHPGNVFDNALIGDFAANVMIAGAGNDLLFGSGGADVLYGGQGDDILLVGDLAFARADGGNGFDSLVLNVSGFHLNLTALANTRLANLEQIDVRGNGANSLTLNVNEVLNLTQNSNPAQTSNTLRVRRNLDDTLEIGAGWTQGSAQTVDGVLYDTFTQGAATLLVENVDPLVTLSIGGTLVEAGGTATVTATLSAASTSDVTVTLGFGGTAAFPIDYARSNTEIVILAGNLTGTITLTAEQDALFEPNDVIVVEIIDVTNGREDQSQEVSRQIIDDDNAPEFTTTPLPSVPENSTTVLTVNATDADPLQEVTYSINGGEDQARFSITAGGLLSFLTPPDFENPTDAGQDNVYVVRVTADDGHEGVTPQVIFVTVTNVDDPIPLVSLSMSNGPLSEAGGTATVTATLSTPSTSDVIVNLGLSGTAQFADDYLSESSQIVIPAGMSTGTFTLTAQQDEEFDPGETIIIDITGVTNGVEDGNQQVSQLISDDDHAPVFISSSTPTVTENETTVLDVVATDEDVPPQTITYSITGGIDQGLFSITFGGTLTFATPPDFENPIDANQNNIYEVQVTANDGHSGVTSQDLLVTVTNINDGTPLVSLSVSAGALVESGGTATITATLSEMTNTDVTINLAFTGTADFPADYTRSAAQVVIPAGDLTGTIILSALQDTDFEVDQTIVVDIDFLTNGVENGNQQVSKPITDDDHAPAFTSTATPSVPENQTSVLTVVAIDDDVPAQLITFSITGGVDQGVFSITPDGVLTFATTPDFELPTDTGFDNIYNVQVTANDGHGGVTAQNIAVIVTDVNENASLNVNGPAATWTKKQAPVNVLPQATVSGSDLAGSSLVISVNAVGTPKKLLDQFLLPSTSNLGTSTGPQRVSGQLKLEIQLAETTTAADIQAFLRGITFSTKGKGLKTPTRTLRVSLVEAGQEVAELTQTINVRKKA